MNHIIQIETESGNVPVGHAEFAAASKFFGTEEDFVIGFIPRAGVTSGGGNVIINISSHQGNVKIECPVYLSSGISVPTGFTIRSINEHLCDWNMDVNTNSTTSQVQFGAHLNLYRQDEEIEMTGIQVNVVAQFPDYDIELMTYDEMTNQLGGTSIDGDAAQSHSEALTRAYYGSQLPDPGIPGRIFFLEVQDE